MLVDRVTDRSTDRRTFGMPPNVPYDLTKSRGVVPGRNGSAARNDRGSTLTSLPNVPANRSLPMGADVLHLFLIARVFVLRVSFL